MILAIPMIENHTGALPHVPVETAEWMFVEEKRTTASTSPLHEKTY
jgi:hypothetical protein